MLLARAAAALVPQAAALVPRVAALVASWSLAIAWAQRDLQPPDLSVLALQDLCRELRVDFAQAEEIAPRMLVQALLSRQRR